MIFTMYKKLILVVPLISILFLGLGGCRKKEQMQKSQKDVLAQVNDAFLSETDLKMNIPEAQRDSIALDQKEDYIRRWIQEEILYQEAKRKGIDQDETVKWQVEQAARITIIEAFLEKELENKIKVSEEEAKQYYEKNKNMFKREEDEVRISHILVRNMAEAGLVAVKLKEGESFEMIAKQMSLDEGTKEKGGDMGYIPLSQLPPDFYEAVTESEVGGVRSIETKYGFHITKVTDKKERGSIREYDLVKDQITNSLIFAKKNQELRRFLEELTKDATIQTFGWASGVFPQPEPQSK
jgi:peptidyl-prolyl cis-trans isomerase C